jgi:DNA transformation protein and related proteins
MNAAQDELTRHCMDLLSPLGRPRAKRMFGGVGLYVDDVFIALIAFERLYLKVDAQTRPKFEAAGCEPFIYDAATKAVAMSYFSAPDDAMESPALMQTWARMALEAALRARAAKPASAPRKTKAKVPAIDAAPRNGSAAKRPAKAAKRRV